MARGAFGGFGGFGGSAAGAWPEGSQQTQTSIGSGFAQCHVGSVGAVQMLTDVPASRPQH